MSDNCLHIVPRIERAYPNSEEKAKKILQWFLDRDMVESGPSDCTLTKQQGYRFKPAIADLFKEGEIWAYSNTLKTHGLEITAGEKRKVFHPMEGAYLVIICKNCTAQLADVLGWKWVEDWYQGQNMFACPICTNQDYLIHYDIFPEWGFSNFGISLWNTHWDLKEESIQAMETLFDCPVTIINVRV